MLSRGLSESLAKKMQAISFLCPVLDRLSEQDRKASLSALEGML